MTEAVDESWATVGISGAAATFLLTTRLSPMWMIGAAAMLGALGIV